MVGVPLCEHVGKVDGHGHDAVAVVVGKRHLFAVLRDSDFAFGRDDVEFDGAGHVEELDEYFRLIFVCVKKIK